jgi:Zn-dependent peptidase ImmA (M78 family)
MTSTPEGKDDIVKGPQLRKARDLLQLDPKEVASELGVDPKRIIDWEENRSQPGLKQLEKMADLYGREMDYFLRETPPLPGKIEFRGKPGESLIDLPRDAKVVLARFDELCRTALELEGLLNRKRKVTLTRFRGSVNPKTAAKVLRGKFDVDDKPLPNLRERLEAEGLRIFELIVPENAFSGFSFWHSEYGPCILLNASDLKGRRNFTLAHELAHLLFGDESSVCYIPLKFGEIHEHVESRTNRFAVELLLPEKGMKDDFKKRRLSTLPSERELAQMSTKWGASIQALGYRLESLGLIADGHTDTL